ncbi:hypothetical protein F2Q68_00017059 [Brassica cretica]|uniref:Uncharacterized protein n=1 Tax=Brassica cretica TaxID=69181 RepID=A0A8S9H9G0_BRACR|nr:hypothetical protein F2Q68_00017059 [Brassica cretica]
MDSSCWTCVSLNKNRRWRWREDGIWLAGLKSLSSWIGWYGMRNRHKFGDENLIRFKEPAGIGTGSEPRSHVEMVRPVRFWASDLNWIGPDLLDSFRETESYGPGSTPGSRTTPNHGNLYLDGRIKTLEEGCSSVRIDLKVDQEASRLEPGHEIVCGTKGKEIEVYQEVMRDDLQEGDSEITPRQ